MITLKTRLTKIARHALSLRRDQPLYEQACRTFEDAGGLTGYVRIGSRNVPQYRHCSGHSSSDLERAIMSYAG